MIKIHSWHQSECLSLFYYFVFKVLWDEYRNMAHPIFTQILLLDDYSERIFILLGIWTSVCGLLGLWTSVFGFLKYIRSFKILWEIGFFWLINIAFGLNVFNFHVSINSSWRYLIHADTTGTNSNASARVWMDYTESVSFNEFYS